MENNPHNPEKSPFSEPEKSKEKKTKKSEKGLEKKTADPPLEKLDDEEKSVVASEIIKARKQEVNRELEMAEPDSTDESESIADATFLEVLDEEIAKGTDIDEALEVAESETLAIAGIDDNEETEPPQETEQPFIPSEEEHEELQDEESPETEIDGEGEEPPGNDESGVFEPDDPDQTPVPVSVPQVSMVGQTPIAAQGTTVETVVNRRSNLQPLLVGGIIGYLIGRRGGRIRTENKLLPIQKSLENEVKTLEQRIYQKEEKIRALTSEKIKQDPVRSQRIIERIQSLQTFKYPESAKKPEETSVPKTEESKPVIEKLMPKKELKDVERMILSEVLGVAEKITFEGSNLRRLFEAGRIDEHSTRKIVKEFLKGAEYNETIRENLKTPEHSLDAIESHNNRAGSPSSVAAIGSPDAYKHETEKAAHIQDVLAGQKTGSENASKNRSMAIATLLVIAVISIILFL